MLDVMLRALNWLSEQYRRVLRPVLVGIFAILTLIVLYAVFMRYVLNSAPSWSEEITRYLMVWSSLLAMGMAIRRGKHIGLTTLVERIFGRYARYAFLLADLSSLAFFVTAFGSGISMTFFVSRQISPSAGIPMWIPYLSVPAGSFFFIIETLILILGKLRSRDEVARGKERRGSV